MVTWCKLSAKEVFRELNTSEQGLTDREAEKRLESYGPNELPEQKIDSWPVIFWRQFKNPLIYILLGATVVVFLLGEYVDGYVILFVLCFNAIVGTIQEGKARTALAALKDFVETFVSVIRNKNEVIILDNKLVPGDVIELREGDKVPADCFLIEANNLMINQAALTGESNPVIKTIQSSKKKKPPIVEQKNMIFKGTSVLSGAGTAVVVATGLKTEIGKIGTLIANIEVEVPFQASLRNFSYLIMALVGVVSVFLIFSGLILNAGDLTTMFLTAVSLAVSVIPEGLPIVSTLILALGITRMAKKNALVKRLQAVEALGETKIMALDKTGTITENKMTIKKIYTNRKVFDVDAKEELKLAGELAAFSTTIKRSSKIAIGDPTEVAIFEFAKKMGFVKKELLAKNPLIGDIPFNRKTKYHVTFNKVDGKKLTTVVGAPEAILLLCKKIWLNSKVDSFSKKNYKEAENALRKLSNDGLRVLAFGFAYSEFDYKKRIPTDLVFGGFFAMEDPVREGVVDAVKMVRRAGMKPVMITGDYEPTAIAIAKQAGIFREKDGVLTDSDLDRLSDKRLEKEIGRVTVFARISPKNKMRIIRAYQRRGELVAMTGDGVNDAPSLVAADLGVAMGKIGTSVAQEASDIVLLDDNFGTLVPAIEEGRHVYQTIKKTILFLFSTSMGEILAITGSIFMGWPLLLLPTQIIWLNLVTDGFLDVPFAWEPKDKKLLEDRENKRSKFIIDGLMIERTIVMALAMMVAGLLVFSFYFEDNLPKALTVTLTTLAMMQWFNAWNVRSETKSIFQMNPLENKPLMAATGIVIVLQLLVIYWAPLQAILRTVPLAGADWGVVFSAALLIIFAEEIRKIFRKSMAKW
ncbi:MAG: HAD-IC family P-type ATPase [Patescibacteria group bacterium]